MYYIVNIEFSSTQVNQTAWIRNVTMNNGNFSLHAVLILAGLPRFYYIHYYAEGICKTLHLAKIQGKLAGN